MIPRITDQPLDLTSLIAATEDTACGALATFTGTVRNTNDGRPVERLAYEAHHQLAEDTLRQLEDEVCERFGVEHCLLQHRVGTLELGEPSVHVVVRSGHRGEAFEAARYAIDELKERTPIWKREHYADGAIGYLEGKPMRTEHPS